jgi:predicted transcriptional regulator
MATIASLIIDVQANTATLVKDVGHINTSLDKVGSAAGKLGGMLAGAFSVGAVTSAVNKFLDFTGALTDMSAKTGISTSELQKLKYAAEQNGGTLEGVSKSVVRLGQSLGKDGAAAAMKLLGLSLDDVRKMDPATQFATIGDAIARLKNPTDQQTAAIALFGKDGASHLAMFKGGLTETMKAAERLGIVLDEDTVAAGDNLGDTLTSLNAVGMATLGKILAPMLPAFQMVASAMMGASGVIDHLRDMFDALVRAGLLALKWLMDSVLKVGELAQKVPLLGRAFGENTKEMQYASDASVWLGGAIAGLEQGTQKATVTTRAAVPPITSLTKAQSDYADAVKKVNDAQIPLTEAQKAAAVTNDAYGVSASDTAKVLRVSAAAVTTYLDSLKNGQEISDTWKKFHEGISDSSKKFINAWIADTTAAGRKVADASAAEMARQYLASVEYKELNYQLTLSGTALVIRQIERERDAKIIALGDASGEIRKYYQFQIDLANHTESTLEARMASKGVFTKGVLQATADDAMQTYLQMAAHSERWGHAAVQHQKEVAEAAQRAATGTSSAWDKTHGALGKVRDVLGLIPGKMAAIGADAVATAQTVMKSLASGDVWGAVIAAASGAVKLITGIWTSFFGTAGRDLVKEFAASMGGFDALHVKLQTLGAAGEALWIKLTQGVGRNNPAEAKAAIEAINAALAGQDAWMARLPELIETYGLSWEQAGIKARQAKLDEIAQGLIQDFADLSRAGFDIEVVTVAMSDAVNAYLQDAVAMGVEVPAAMRPLLQKMLDLGLLTDAAGVKLEDLTGITFATTLTQGFRDVVDAIHELTQALGGAGSAIDALNTRRVRIPVEEAPSGPGEEGGIPASRAAARLSSGGMSVVSRGGGGGGSNDTSAIDRHFLLTIVPKAIEAAVQKAVA